MLRGAAGDVGVEAGVGVHSSPSGGSDDLSYMQSRLCHTAKRDARGSMRNKDCNMGADFQNQVCLAVLTFCGLCLKMASVTCSHMQGFHGTTLKDPAMVLFTTTYFWTLSHVLKPQAVQIAESSSEMWSWLTHRCHFQTDMASDPAPAFGKAQSQIQLYYSVYHTAHSNEQVVSCQPAVACKLRAILAW